MTRPVWCANPDPLGVGAHRRILGEVAGAHGHELAGQAGLPAFRAPAPSRSRESVRAGLQTRTLHPAYLSFSQAPRISLITRLAAADSTSALSRRNSSWL